jgi:hypothetical protein
VFPPGPLLLELGSYIILAARSRGDYGWIGQAARALSLSLFVARLHTWYKTAQEDNGREFELTRGYIVYVLLLCGHIEVVHANQGEW